MVDWSNVIYCVEWGETFWGSDTRVGFAGYTKEWSQV